jgi:hypothetical protein
LPGRGHRLGKKTFYQSNRNVALYAIKKFQLPLQAKLNKNSKNKQKYLKLLGLFTNIFKKRKVYFAFIAVQ